MLLVLCQPPVSLGLSGLVGAVVVVGAVAVAAQTSRSFARELVVGVVEVEAVVDVRVPPGPQALVVVDRLPF